MSRWYRCPSTIHEFNQDISDTCWRCHESKGNMFHIWRECPPVRRFWKHIFDPYGKSVDTTIHVSPRVALLTMIPGSLKKAKEDVLRHFLAAAKAVIPRHWKSTTVLSLGEWAIEMDFIRDLSLVHTINPSD